MRVVAHAIAAGLAVAQLLAAPVAAFAASQTAADGPAQLSAGAVGYLCQLDVAYSQRWVPPILFIAHDPESGKVVISDPVALFYNSGLPVNGRVASETTARISFAWDYPVATGGQETRKMLYRAGIDRATGRATVTAMPAGFSAVFQASGRCEAQPLEELAAQP